MAIIIPDQFVPNTADHKALDTDYVQHTYGGVAETQTSINDNVKKLDAATSYVVCDTAAATAIKEVTIPNYSLYNGGSIRIKFTYINTSGVSVTTRTVSSNTSYTIQANTTFTITNDKSSYFNSIYQNGTFKAEAEGSWTSANLSSNTTFRIESSPISSGE